MSISIQGRDPAEYYESCKRHGVCIVVGGSPDVHTEFYQARREYPSAALMAINASAALLPGCSFQYMATVHSSYIDCNRWMRREHIDNVSWVIGQNCNGIEDHRIDEVLDIRGVAGGANYAVAAALTKHPVVVTAGVSLEEAPYYDENVDEAWRHRWYTCFAGRVFGYGGLIKEIYGGPQS